MTSESRNAGEPLPPFRFSLLTLLGAVTLISLLLGISRWIPASWMAMGLLVLLAIGAHVAGNAIGTRLRDGRPRPKRRPTAPAAAIALDPAQFAPVTTLHGKSNFSWRIPLITAAGMLGGMASGWYYMHITYGDRLALPAIVITFVACGSLGGLISFMIGSFLHVLINAIRHSHREQQN